MFNFCNYYDIFNLWNVSNVFWFSGKGLGKEETGIVNPIKAKLKFDKQGVSISIVYFYC